MQSRHVEENCRRRDPRRPVNRVAVAFRRDGRRSLVAVTEISLGGLQINDASFDVNEEFWLVMPNRGVAPAKVCWSSSSQTGVMFDEEGSRDLRFAPEEISVRRCFAASRAHGSFGKREQTTGFVGSDIR
jgi:hypothetical protein